MPRALSWALIHAGIAMNIFAQLLSALSLGRGPMRCVTVTRR